MKLFLETIYEEVNGLLVYDGSSNSSSSQQIKGRQENTLVKRTLLQHADSKLTKGFRDSSTHHNNAPQPCCRISKKLKRPSHFEHCGSLVLMEVFDKSLDSMHLVPLTKAISVSYPIKTRNAYIIWMFYRTDTRNGRIPPSMKGLGLFSG